MTLAQSCSEKRDGWFMSVAFDATSVWVYGDVHDVNGIISGIVYKRDFIFINGIYGQ